MPEKAMLSHEYSLYYMQSFKQSYNVSKLCQLSSEAQVLINFCKEVEGLSFSQKPDYQKLRSILNGLYQHQNQLEFSCEGQVQAKV